MAVEVAVELVRVVVVGAVVAGVAQAVAVAVLLGGVLQAQAVVADVAGRVAVFVVLVFVGVLEAVVADVAQAVAVAVELVVVEFIGAVVALVANAVPAQVLAGQQVAEGRVGVSLAGATGRWLVDVLDLGADVAGITDAIAVDVGLVFVGHQRAVVAAVAERVGVALAEVDLPDGGAGVADVGGTVAVGVELVVVGDVGAAVAGQRDRRFRQVVVVHDGDVAGAQAVPIGVVLHHQVLAAVACIVQVVVGVGVGVALVVDGGRAQGVGQVDRGFVADLDAVAVEVLRHLVLAGRVRRTKAHVLGQGAALDALEGVGRAGRERGRQREAEDRGGHGGLRSGAGGGGRR